MCDSDKRKETPSIILCNKILDWRDVIHYTARYIVLLTLLLPAKRKLFRLLCFYLLMHQLVGLRNSQFAGKKPKTKYRTLISFCVCVQQKKGIEEASLRIFTFCCLAESSAIATCFFSSAVCSNPRMSSNICNIQVMYTHRERFHRSLTFSSSTRTRKSA